ncbi:MAG TPA: Nramp family divalent metal transporter [Chitinophagaceae bacterium]|nr:Nramp family divalent metal transporter [Chitinophagaceae bacterium]
MSADNYIITNSTIKEPPASLRKKIRFLGPGFILSASIVGSGELIATTVLGARAGFIAFWVIIISCLIKVAVQLEFGKQAILTGETVMQSFNKLPGIRPGNVSWAVWTAFILTSLKVIQLGGMVGGTAIILHMLFGKLPIYGWVIIVVIASSIMIYRGFYKIVEKISLVMIAGFTVTTITALFVLRYTPFSFSWNDVLQGLQFKLPAEIVPVAFGAFGITGVASDEIIAYNYWCIEKGYAAYAGPRDDSPEWRKRAKGWINVMYLDATAAMLIYTTVTAAFYLLGAAILHNRTIIPHGNGVIETLALIYTQSLGAGAKITYLVGAFFVLFSSVFVSLAAWTRLYSDIFGQMKWINFFNLQQRKRTVSWLAWIIPCLWAIVYFFINLPVLMILFGGIVGSVLLFVVVYAAIHFRKNRIRYLPSGIFYNIAFTISVLSIIGVGIYGLFQLFSF